MKASTDDEEETEVRLVDQEKINEFGRLNNRLLEIRAEIVQVKDDLNKIDDSVAEMESFLSDDGKVKLLIGEAFIECDEDFANDYLEKKKQV